MAFKQFLWSIILRLGMVMTMLSVMIYLLVTPGYHAATLLTLCLSVGLILNLHSYVTRTNQELVRFLDAARYADFGQRFDGGKLGAGFEDLGAAFTEILERHRDDRADRETELRHLKAMVEHVPVPLISLQNDSSIRVWNNAARRLFGTVRMTRLTDFDVFGEDIGPAIKAARPGERRLMVFHMDGIERQLTIASTELIIAGQTERLISLQDIQSELDGAQLQAWQDLVRVLTHEIMNSITPVASLARTTVDLVDDAKARAEGQDGVLEPLEDARSAAETVARRSDGLMHFVSSYRRLTRLPPPEKSLIAVGSLFEGVARLAEEDLAGTTLTLETTLEPASLELEADRDMIEQVLLNLLKNAVHAAEQSGATQQTGGAGSIHLIGRLNRRGHVVLEVADSGPGIPEDIRDKIFVPFFTTKRDGSGVGLALTRQVMIAHGGQARLTAREDYDGGVLPAAQSGAVFSLIF